MAISNKYFDPQHYYYKVIIICILIGIDIILNTFTQFLDFGDTLIIRKYNITNFIKDTGIIAFILMS
jgi:hypothetical protein